MHKKIIINLVFLLLLNEINCKKAALSKISLKGNLFADDKGRIKLFHGMNAVNKEFPWYPIGLTNTTQLDNLKLWGFNAVRLGVMWTGLRPDFNTVNQTYLNIILKIIDDLSQRGIYVIIDMHQDMMSTKFAAYDGVPRWLVDLMPNSTFPYPWPFKNYNLGFTAYLTDACGSAFQNLYSNVNKFQDYFAEYWSIVSKTLSNVTSVLGYEFINEPWAGDIFTHPELLLPGQAGRKNLLPMYDNLYHTIRKYDNETLVFYEPVTWGILFNGTRFGTGFDRAPANDPNRTVLSWHYYCWLLQFNSNPLVNNTYPLFDRIVCDDIQRKFAFDTVKFDRKVIGGGSFLTEFGVCAFGMTNGTLITTECEYILDASDVYFQSWAYWDSNFYTGDGGINYPIIDIFSRVYPQSTSGIPLNLYYNTTTAIFIYEYEHDPAIVEATEIFIPEHVYPNGFQVSVSDHLKYEFNHHVLFVSILDNNMMMQPFDAKIMVIPMKYF
jgi:endoglycosylceramidase